MKFFRRSDYSDIEGRLRDDRPQPRADFLSALTEHLSRAKDRRPLLRPAFALSLSIVMLSLFAAFGGVNYAASAAKQAVQTQSSNKNDDKGKSDVKAGNTNNNTAGKNDDKGKKDDKGKPDDDEYKPGKGCGDKNHVHEKENECKKPPK